MSVYHQVCNYIYTFDCSWCKNLKDCDVCELGFDSAVLLESNPIVLTCHDYDVLDSKRGKPYNIGRKSSYRNRSSCKKHRTT